MNTGQFQPVVVVPGEQFGDWRVLAEVAPRRRPSGKYYRYVRCQCTCGVEREVDLARLRKGRSRSCGHTIQARHGQARTGQTRPSRLYRLWVSIKQRCFNPRCESYRYYGERGITMYEGWVASFECFERDVLAEIGPHPGKGWSIDRINNDGDYRPGNLRWATPSEQLRNQRRHRRVEAA